MAAVTFEYRKAFRKAIAPGENISRLQLSRLGIGVQSDRDVWGQKITTAEVRTLVLVLSEGGNTHNSRREDTKMSRDDPMHAMAL